MSRHTHPDMGGSATEFAKVQAAHEVLSDPAQRKRYDTLRAIVAGMSAPPGSEPHPEPDQAQTGPTIYGVPKPQRGAAAIARAIEQLPLSDSSFVFHQCANFDHIIVAGNQLVTVTVTAVAEGHWLWDPDRGAITRDSRHSSTVTDLCRNIPQDAAQLAAQLGWTEPDRYITNLLIVANEKGHERNNVNVDLLQPPGVAVTSVAGVAPWFLNWNTDSFGVVANTSALSSLHAQTTAPATVITTHRPPHQLPADIAPLRPPPPIGATAAVSVTAAAALLVAAAAAVSVAATVAAATIAAAATVLYRTVQRPAPAPTPTLFTDLAHAAGSPTAIAFAPTTADTLLALGSLATAAAATAGIGPGPAAAAVSATVVAICAAHPATCLLRHRNVSLDRTIAAAADPARTPLIVNAVRAHPNDPHQHGLLAALEQRPPTADNSSK